MVNESEFKGMSDEELLTKKKAAKSSLILSSTLVGFLVGIAVYSAVRNGIGFFTFFPLIFVFLVARNQATHKALLNEIKVRNLE